MTVHQARVIVIGALLLGVGFLTPSLALAAEGALPVERQSTATDVFDKNSPAIVTILTPSGFGSGVLVDPSGVIVTNLHVVEGDVSAKVTLANGDIYDDVRVVAVDARRDIIVIKIAGFQLPTVELGDSDTVAVGEAVYAIGSPRGFALTISDGIISGKRPSPGDEGSQVLQITAAISPGSSGGGLFDGDGRLVGVTTSGIPGGGSLNFAVPINYVRGIISTQPKWSLAEFRRRDETARPPTRASRAPSGDVRTRTAAEQGDAEAQVSLGLNYEIGRTVPRDHEEARRWYRLAADQGHAEAQYMLAAMYRSGRGTQNDVEAARLYRLAAEQGHLNAQRSLSLMYKEGAGVEQDYVAAHMWLNIVGSRMRAQGLRRSVYQKLAALEKLMTAEQIAEAQRRAREWKPTSAWAV